MKNKILAALAFASLLFTSQGGLAQEKSAAATELKELVTKVQAKVMELRPPSPPGTPRKIVKISEADMSDELKQFDTLLAKHPGEKTDDVVQILYMKYMVYSQVIGDKEKGTELLAQLKKEFPDSKLVANMKREEEQEAETQKIQDALAIGTKFPDFNEKDLTGKPLSIANYKGKVVLIDFWATWCAPCRAEVPNVVAVYNKHHSNGFEIIGISLDRQPDKAKLESYTKENKMPWPQFFDGQFWNNKLSTKYGVRSIPATYLLDGEGKIIGKGDDIRGENLDGAVAKALARK
jgi:thiol-disulfide isomerase/thioredoxin